MSLPDAELNALAELLAPALELLIPGDLFRALPPLPAGRDATRTAAWLRSLDDVRLGHLLERLPANDRTRSARARLAAPPPKVGAPPPHLILNGMPVVDRVEIWSRLHALHSGHPRILMIRGPRFSGKTYTKWLVLEFCGLLGPDHEALQPLDLDGYHTLEAIADDVLATLGAAGTRQAFDDAHATPRAWARSVARHVFQVLSAPGRARWLVFDHFERTPRTEAAIAFFLNLAEQIVAIANRPQSPRLILIDHAGGVPPVARGITLEEEVHVASETDVLTFVRAYRPAWSDAEQLQETRRILAQLTRRDSFMEDLDLELRSLPT